MPRVTKTRLCLFAGALSTLLAVSTGHAYFAGPRILGTGNSNEQGFDRNVDVDRPQGQVLDPASGQYYQGTRPLALTEFVLTAAEGDHHIGRIGAEANATAGWFGYAARVAFRHREGNADPMPYTYRIGMILPTEAGSTFVTKAVREDCPGSCVVTMPGARAGYRFVLSGFRFERPKTEAYVRRVTVMPEPNGDVRVRFQDNGNPTFKAEVSGLWIPNSLVDGSLHDETVTYTPNQTAPRIDVGAWPYALVGFDFEFTNGDHKLNTIGLRYASPNLSPRFADKNTDDPWRARVRWVKLRR